MNDLVRRAQAGDAAAWAALEAAFRPHLLRVAQRLLGPGWPERSRSDLVQTTWLRAVRAIATFRGADRDEQTAAVFRAWLAQTMQNAWKNELRDEQTQRRRAPPGTLSLDAGGDDSAALGVPGVLAPDPTPSRQAGRAEVCALVRQALERLEDPRDREVVLLHCFQGLPLREVADCLGLTYDQVRYRFQAVKERLGQELEHLR